MHMHCNMHVSFLPVYLFPASLNYYNLTLLQATYNIIHNGTGQILGVDVDIVLGEIRSNQNSYIQNYAIRFQHQVNFVIKSVLVIIVIILTGQTTTDLPTVW